MGHRHFKGEQIIQMLPGAETKLVGGKTTEDVYRELGISEQSFQPLVVSALSTPQ